MVEFASIFNIFCMLNHLLIINDKFFSAT